ncbi:glycosyltransferase [Vibrio splendidus]
MNNRVCVIVSMYNPQVDVIDKLLLRLMKDVSRIYLVDNSEKPIKFDIDKYDKVHIIQQDNSGITGAVNSAVNASNFDFDFYLLLDQDSLIDFDNFKVLLSGALKENLDITAPIILDKNNESIHENFFNKGEKYKNFQVVTRTQLSGMLISKKALIDVGLLNESFFLNLGDTEWCLRAHKKGYPIYINKNSIMYHEFGDGFKNVMGYNFFYGAPFRLYYKSRDSMKLIFSSVSNYKVKTKLCMKLLLTPFEIIFLDNKIERFTYFFRGFLAFASSEHGRMKD